MDDAIRILIIESVDADAQRIEQELRRGHPSVVVRRVDTKDAFLKALDEFAPHLVLSDYILPHFDAVSAMTLMQTRAPDVPFIIVSGIIGEELAIDAMKSGATDYVIKQRLTRLLPSVFRALREAEDRVQRKRAEDALRVRIGQQAVVSELGQRALEGAELSELMQEAVAKVIETVEVECCEVLELAADGSAFTVRAGKGWRSGLLGATVAGGTGSHAGFAVHSKRPLIFDDVRRETRFRTPAYLLEHGVVSGMCVIVSGRGRPYGVLAAYTTKHRPFTPNDTSFLQAIANVLSTAIERRRNEEEQLRLQQELARGQRMETVGRFAGGIAHDFSHFLSVILGFAQLLRLRHKDDPKLLADLQEIAHAGESATQLVQQLLAFTKNQVIESKVFELNQTIRGMDRLVRQLVGEPIKVEIALDEKPLAVRMDPTGLEQIIMNLCSNARDAMAGGGQLTIRTSCVTVDDAFRQSRPWANGHAEYVRLSIRDTGSGMPPEVAAHIFEPFFSTKGRRRGTGLGLAVVYGLVQQHEGAVEVETALGQGTAFHLYFPIQQEEAVCPR